MTVGPWSAQLIGRLETIELDAPSLVGNALGDPDRRPALVYLPPGYDDADPRRYPSVYVLQGFRGFVTTWLNRRSFELSAPELIDAAIARDEVPPCIVVFVDAWTRLGGSQFVDSPATGRYHSYLCEDVITAIDAQFRTIADRDHRGVLGHSSGGNGALVSAMWRPDRFGALASLAGDAAFELTLLPEIADSYRALRDRYGSLESFLDELAGAPENGLQPDQALLSIYAYAACYSADEDGAVRLPFDPSTGALDEAVFARWLAFDPVRMVPRFGAQLLTMRAIYLDAGRSDEYHLDVAAELVAAALREKGIGCTLELYVGGHGNYAPRVPIALGVLAEALTT